MNFFSALFPSRSDKPGTDSNNMKAITTSGWGLKPQLVIENRPSPAPGPDDVLVRVHAASVNPKDWKLNLTASILATPLLRQRIRPLFGDDLAGDVIGVGANVKDFKVGDKVYGMDMRLRTASLAEEAVIHQNCIAPMPNNLSYKEAAAMPLAALTALQGLRLGNTQEGTNVLLIGASGGVGTYAVQIAKALGARVTAVCSGRNTELVKELGADKTIDYTVDDFRESAGPFDVVFDIASYDTPRSCSKLMGDQGIFISTFGHAPGLVSTALPLNRRVKNVTVKSRRKDLETLKSMAESGLLRSIIDSEFPLEKSQAAYERSRTGRAQGKIVIIVRQETA